MAEETLLSDEFVRQLTAVGEVDILVGLPTLNNRKTVERVVGAIQVGLVKYYPRERSVLINPDGGSKDGTPEAVKATAIQDFRTVLASDPLRTMHTLTTSYHGIQGPGGALRIILAAADLLRAKACAIVSPDLQSITPEWIEGLVRPIYKENFDFVAPIYQRRRFDGLLIKNILSPLIRAAYGYRIEEPVGGEFGFSGRLACHYLEQDVWRQDFIRFGADLWMTTAAMAGDYRLCQSFLGPKIHTSKESARDLVGAIQQTVGALFHSLEIHEPYWMSRQGSQPVPAFGFEPVLDLDPVHVNRKRMFEMFQGAVEQLASILEKILSASTLQEIREISKLDEKNFRFPDELWIRTIYEFASSYHRSVINRDHLLQALTPLYRGRISSFILEHHRTEAQEIEKRLEALCLQYERLRPYLIEGWNAQA